MAHYTQRGDVLRTKTGPLVPSHVQNSANLPFLPVAGSVNLGLAGQGVPYQLSNNDHQYHFAVPAQPTLQSSLEKVRESRAPSSGTYVVSSPIYQTQPIFVDQLVYPNNHSTHRPRRAGTEKTSNQSTFPNQSHNYSKGHRELNVSTSLASPQASKIVRSSDNGSSLYSAIDHWSNYGSRNRTTSESLNSRRGCRRIPLTSR